ncbi:hypothetical protein ACVWWG_009330 [Bradyrhizobium sp. LB7.2]
MLKIIWNIGILFPALQLQFERGVGVSSVVLRLQDLSRGCSRKAPVHAAVRAGREGLERDAEFPPDDPDQILKSAGERFLKS